MMKELKPGRVIIVTHDHHYNKLGIFLSITSSRELKFKVLVLDDVVYTNSTAVSENIFYKKYENIPSCMARTTFFISSVSHDKSYTHWYECDSRS